MSGRPRILLVDDEAQLVQLMSRYLERLGYEALFAGTTSAAWKIVEDGPAFAVVIIDVSLQDPTGEELGERVLAAAPQTKVILTSGYAADIRQMESTFPCRVAFLQKPFSGEMLADVVRRVAGPETRCAG